MPALQEKLEQARAKWEASFWRNSGLPRAQKADSNAAITATEAAAIKQVVNELTGDAWSQALYDELSIMVEAGYVSAGDVLQAAGMTLDVDWKTIPPATLEAMRQNAEQFAFMVNQREQQALFDIIDNAVLEGQTPKELSAVINQTFKDGYHVTAEGQGIVKRYPTDTWSKMVARTELSRAQTMGNMALYQAAGIEKVMWVTSQGANVCPECEELDGEVFDLDDVNEPPLHPNCACALMAADEDVKYQEAA